MTSRSFSAIAAAVLVVALAGCASSSAPTPDTTPSVSSSPTSSPVVTSSPTPSETAADEYDGPSEDLPEEAQSFLFFEESEVRQLVSNLGVQRSDELDAELVEMAYQLCEYWGLENTAEEREFQILNTQANHLDELFGKDPAYSGFFWRTMPSVSTWFCPTPPAA